MNINQSGFNLAARGPLGTLGADRCNVQRADRELLESLWAEVASELSRLVLAMGLGQSQRDDVLQDVYVTALQQCPAGLAHAELRRWLFRVTINECNLHHRRASRWRTVVRAVARLGLAADSRAAVSPSTEAEQPLASREERQLVRRGLAALERDLRTVLVLWYYAQLNSKEIGRILKVPDSTVRSRLREARMRLARQLEQTGYEHP